MADETPDNDVARYAAAVRGALSNLPAAKRDVVLEDLEDHLAEVAAESGLPLASRLGPPEEYAAELRAAYGAGHQASRLRFPRIRRLLRGALFQLSGWRSYHAVRDYLPELRPAWWVLRAYLAVLVLAVMLRGDQTIHPIPNEYPLTQTRIGGTRVVPPRVAVPPIAPSPSPFSSPSTSPSPSPSPSSSR